MPSFDIITSLEAVVRTYSSAWWFIATSALTIAVSLAVLFWFLKALLGKLPLAEALKIGFIASIFGLSIHNGSGHYGFTSSLVIYTILYLLVRIKNILQGKKQVRQKDFILQMGQKN